MKAVTDFQRIFTKFAAGHIAGQTALFTAPEFPKTLWANMAAHELFGVGIPRSYGGRGHGWLEISLAGHGLVAAGGNPGVATAWLLHEIVSRFLVLGFGSDDQRRDWLPDLAKGRKIACFAVSEPKTGAHPKHLKTAARPQDDGWVLSGAKTYLTNGPMADLFVVIARTGQKQGRNTFGAFLVPRGVPGLSLTAPLDVGFLKPAMHGGIQLADCRLPAKSLLSNPHCAYDDMVLPFREVEDTLMAGLICGGMEKQMCLLQDHLKICGIPPGNDFPELLGRLCSLFYTCRLLARQSARMLAEQNPGDELTGVLLCARQLWDMFQACLADCRAMVPPPTDTLLDLLTKDLVQVSVMARGLSLAKQKKLGERLLGFAPIRKGSIP